MMYHKQPFFDRMVTGDEKWVYCKNAREKLDGLSLISLLSQEDC